MNRPLLTHYFPAYYIICIKKTWQYKGPIHEDSLSLAEYLLPHVDVESLAAGRPAGWTCSPWLLVSTQRFSGSWQNDCAALCLHHNNTNAIKALLRSDPGARSSTPCRDICLRVTHVQNWTTLKAICCSYCDQNIYICFFIELILIFAVLPGKLNSKTKGYKWFSPTSLIPRTDLYAGLRRLCPLI